MEKGLFQRSITHPLGRWFKLIRYLFNFFFKVHVLSLLSFKFFLKQNRLVYVFYQQKLCWTAQLFFFFFSLACNCNNKYKYFQLRQLNRTVKQLKRTVRACFLHLGKRIDDTKTVSGHAFNYKILLRNNANFCR